MTIDQALDDATIKRDCLRALMAHYDQDMAEDAWQQACLVAWEEQPYFATPKKAKRYFLSVAFRRAKQFARQRSELFEEGERLGVEGQEVPSIETFWVEAEENESADVKQAAMVQQVREAIATLPPALAKVIAIRLSHPKLGWNKAVMKACHCSSRSARSRINDALKALQQQYRGRFEAAHALLERHQPSYKKNSAKSRTEV